MININLLPSDLAPKESVIRVSKTLKKISASGFIIFILISAIGIGTFFYFENEIKDSDNRQTTYKSTIGSLETTEQSLVIIRDRVQKASNILGESALADRVGNIRSLSSSLPEQVILEDIQVSSDKTTITVGTVDSIGLKELFKSFEGSSFYEKIVLVSLNFNPKSGYTVGMELF